MAIVIAANKPWYQKTHSRIQDMLAEEVHFCSTSADLTLDRLAEIKPQYIFFLHWSDLIPAAIFEKFECVVFHMTDLPFGRGGSPLQNLISRGIQETKISAIRCEKELDAGPIYLKRPLCLHGNAEEIYLRAANEMLEMIREIVVGKLSPVDQTGQAVYFKRRTPAESNIGDIESLARLFDHIRMLDAEGYPHAFLEAGNFRFEFRRASRTSDQILCDVVIRERADA